MEPSLKTTRQEMLRLLKEEGPVSAHDLSKRLGISEKEVYVHLPHVSKSASAQKLKLRVIPPQCLNCGYPFRDRTRFTPAGRCPRCKGTHLKMPAYEVI